MEVNEGYVTEGVEMTDAPVVTSDKVSNKPKGHKVGNTQDGEGKIGTQVKALGPDWREALKRKLEVPQSRLAEGRKKVKDRKIEDLELSDAESISTSSDTKSAVQSNNEAGGRMRSARGHRGILWQSSPHEGAAERRIYGSRNRLQS